MNVSIFPLRCVLTWPACGGGVGGSTTDPDPTDMLSATRKLKWYSCADSWNTFPFTDIRTAAEAVIPWDSADASAVKGFRVNGVSAQSHYYGLIASMLVESCPIRQRWQMAGFCDCGRSGGLVEWGGGTTVPWILTLERLMLKRGWIWQHNSRSGYGNLSLRQKVRQFQLSISLDHRLIDRRVQQAGHLLIC